MNGLFGLLVAGALAQEAPSALEQAYAKEYAYLRAERDELVRRLAEIDTEGAARVADEQAELDALQAKLVRTSRAADRAEDAFATLDRETASMDDAGTLVATTLSQGGEALDVVVGGDPAVGLPILFEAASARMAEGSRVGWTEGAFFLPDGRLTNGRVYVWGRVAAWGVSPDGAGALVPAGDGRLQVRQAFGRGTADALAVGATPPALEVHLFEPERAVEDVEEGGGLGKVLDDAGTMGRLLFGLGLFSALLATLRALTLAFARRGGQRLVDAVVRNVAAGRSDLAALALGGRRNPTARVLGALIDASGRSRAEQERVADEAILAETPRIDRFASALVVITAGSPLLGLLGTVTGMIATFDVITQHGTGNPKLMSAGIAEALVCTALGLAVAIPTLLVGNVLASVADGIKNTLDRGALGLLNALDLRDRALDLRAAIAADATPDAPPVRPADDRGIGARVAS